MISLKNLLKENPADYVDKDLSDEELIRRKKKFDPNLETNGLSEDLNSSAYSQLSRSIKAIAINIKDLAKAHKKQDDSVVRNEIDNLMFDVKRMVKIIGDKKYNESTEIVEGPDADLGKKLKQIQNQIYKLGHQYKSKANVPAMMRSFMLGVQNQLKKDKLTEFVNERSNPSDKKELMRALKNSKVADVFSLNNDELVIEMTSPSNEDFRVGNIRKYKGD